jgi:hypothetical protein
VQAAMRAGDREAIRVILKARSRQEQGGEGKTGGGDGNGGSPKRSMGLGPRPTAVDEEGGFGAALSAGVYSHVSSVCLLARKFSVYSVTPPCPRSYSSLLLLRINVFRISAGGEDCPRSVHSQ